MSTFIVFLNINGYNFIMPEDEAEDYTVRLADDSKYATNDCIKLMVEELEIYIEKVK